MKIRIGDQSLRVRLSTEEADALEKGASLSTSLRLNAIDSFEFELRTWNLSIGEVHSEKHKLIASIPQHASHQLATVKGFLYRCQQASGMHPDLTLEVEIDLQKQKHT
jgi:hypothetical protein